MFVRVQPDKLVPGIKYKITVFPNKVEFDRYSGVFKELTNGVEYTTLKFDYPYDLIEEKKCYVNKVFLVSHHYHYYVFVSQQPQWKMERRSVNLILRRLIGDDHFEW